MRQLLLLISLMFASQAMAVCSSPISRTNYSTLQLLTSSSLNTNLNTAYTRLNELPGDCIEAESITTAQIDDGTILNADISASAAIDLTKTRYAVAIVTNEKAVNVADDSVYSANWSTRKLNTEYDPDGIVGLASNQMTLQSGTYVIEASATGYNPGKLKLKNMTDTSDAIIGQNSSVFASGTGGTLNESTTSLVGMVTIAAGKAFELQQNTPNMFATFGLAQNVTTVEVYTIVKITRIK